MSLARKKQFKVLLADDHDLVRRGLRALIERAPEWKVCGEAATGAEAVIAAGRRAPDVVVVDLKMPDFNGLEVVRRIKRRLPDCEFLIFTGGPETDELIRDVFACGAKSFILKTEAVNYLMEALSHLAAHKPFFTEKASAVMFARFSHPRTRPPRDHAAADQRLSPGEHRLVRLLANGHSNATAARTLGVTERKMEIARAGIMSRLQLKSFADLIRYAARNRLIKV